MYLLSIKSTRSGLFRTSPRMEHVWIRSTEDADVIEAFSEISNDIEIVKDGWGMAYIPDWGFNGLGNLEYARGYQIKMINQVDGFQFESVIASSMDNNEALIALEQLLFNLQENMIAQQLE